MVKFDNSTLLPQGDGSYHYKMQKGDTVYAIADQIAKATGGNTNRICEELIRQSLLTTRNDEPEKIHVNKILPNYEINLGAKYNEFLSQFLQGSSPQSGLREIAGDPDANRGQSTATRAQRFASDLSHLVSIDPHYTARNFAAENPDLVGPVGGTQNQTRRVTESASPSPAPATGARQTPKKIPDGDVGVKTEYSPAELAARQRDLRDPDPGLVAEVSGHGLLALVTDPEIQKKVADLTGMPANPLLEATISHAVIAEADTNLFREPAAENPATEESAQPIQTERGIEDDDSGVVDEFDEGEGHSMNRISPDDQATIDALRDFQTENMPVHEFVRFDAETGVLHPHSSEAGAVASWDKYTAAEKDVLEQILSQPLRAAMTQDELGDFDTDLFVALRRHDLWVLIPRWIDRNEADNLAEYLFNHYRTGSMETRRATHMLTSIAANREPALSDGEREALRQARDNLNAPSAVADTGPEEKKPIFDTDQIFEEEFGDERGSSAAADADDGEDPAKE